MRVKKRDNTLEPLDIEKIHRAVLWACDGLDVSLSEIETGAHIQFFDGIGTDQIQKALIASAASLIDKDKMDYEFAAARLLLQQIYKEVTGGSVEYPPLFDYICLGVAESRLSESMFGFDMDKLDKAIKPERDLKFKYLGMQTIYDRYLIRGEPKNGRGIGQLIELPQHFWMRVAMGIALAEAESERTDWAIEFYNILSNFEFVNSTPTLFNSGTLHSQMSSCFVTTVDDSIFEPEGESVLGKGIFSSFTECALYSKFSGGLGTDWTRVRPTGGHIKSTNGQSSGIVPYLKAFSDISVAVNQCHAPDTLIYTSKGIKRIENIKVGDLVLGQRGEHRAVTDVMKYAQGTNPMVSINVKHSSSPMRVTSGHPIFAIQNVAGEQSVARTMAQIKSGKLKLDWVEAEKIKSGDYVSQVVSNDVNVVDGFTCDDARMYGIMLGDGHITKEKLECGVTLGFAKSDTRDFVVSYLTNRGVNFWETKSYDKKCTSIRWAKQNREDLPERTELGQFSKSDAFTNLPFTRDDLYSESDDKRISPRFNLLPEDQALNIVRGLVETDGNISRGKEITFSNSSEELIEGIRYQLLRLGIPTSSSKKISSNAHLSGSKKEFSISWTVRIPAVEKIAKIFGCEQLTKKNWLEMDGMIFSRVKSVEEINPVEFVYDLKVEGDESYMTNAALVHNGGKRQGSFAVFLEPWHGDVERFIDLKKPNGDENLRARELFPAMWMNDLFMERVRDRQPWSLFCSNKNQELHSLYGDEFKSAYLAAEDRGDAIKIIDAFELWKKVITALVESGAPWITFKDEFNRRNPQDHCGVIHSSNLCTEIALNTSDDESAVCNLGSINLSVLKPHDFRRVIPVAMRMLDNVIDLNFYPTDKARRSNLKHRPVGLGLMGWTDFVVESGVDWESEEHLRLTDSVFEQFSYWAIRGSVELAKERGAYGSFKYSKWDRGILPIDTARDLPKEWSAKESVVDWAQLREALKKYGIRNSNCTAIAPTATIANIVGTTPCIEPTYKQVFLKENTSGKFKVVDPAMRHGRHDLCKVSFNIDQRWIIKAAAMRQKWLCQSQSVNLFKRSDVKGGELTEWYFLAWELGLKSTYYLKQQTSRFTPEESGIKEGIDVDHRFSTQEALVCSIDNPQECEACQ